MRWLLVSLYEATTFVAFELDHNKKKDYIANPKEDGYRSVHLIYKYRGESQGGAFKGLKIEVQIRSRLQHAWATALETIDAFKGQGLKSGVGEEPWKRFFVLVSAFMSMFEKQPLVPGISISAEILAELCALCDQLNVPNIFEGLSVGVAKGARMSPRMQAYILQLDSKERSTTTWSYPSNKLAEDDLLKLEKKNADKPHIQTVMASASSVQALRSAYKSYYADTTAFVGFIYMLKGMPKDKPEEILQQ